MLKVRVSMLVAASRLIGKRHLLGNRSVSGNGEQGYKLVGCLNHKLSRKGVFGVGRSELQTDVLPKRGCSYPS